MKKATRPAPLVRPSNSPVLDLTRVVGGHYTVKLTNATIATVPN
jgi:hypothetical protein